MCTVLKLLQQSRYKTFPTPPKVASCPFTILCCSQHQIITDMFSLIIDQFGFLECLVNGIILHLIFRVWLSFSIIILQQVYVVALPVIGSFFITGVVCQCMCIHNVLSIHLVMDIWAVSKVLAIMNKGLMNIVMSFMSLYRHMFSFLLDKYPGVRL